MGSRSFLLEWLWHVGIHFCCPHGVISCSAATVVPHPLNISHFYYQPVPKRYAYSDSETAWPHVVKTLSTDGLMTDSMLRVVACGMSIAYLNTSQIYGTCATTSCHLPATAKECRSTLCTPTTDETYTTMT